MDERTESILSHGERDVAGYLSSGADVDEIARARGVSEESVRKSIERVREKTRRATTTLVESPFTTDVVRDLDEERRQALQEALGRADE